MEFLKAVPSALFALLGFRAPTRLNFRCRVLRASSQPQERRCVLYAPQDRAHPRVLYLRILACSAWGPDLAPLDRHAALGLVTRRFPWRPWLVRYLGLKEAPFHF